MGVTQENLLHTLRILPISVWYVYGTLVQRLLKYGGDMNFFYYYVTLYYTIA